MRDTFNKLSSLSWYFLTYDSENKKLLLRKKLTSGCTTLTVSNYTYSKHAFERAYGGSL